MSARSSSCRGTPHRFQSVGDALARILVLFTPSGMDVVGPPLAVSHPV